MIAHAISDPLRTVVIITVLKGSITTKVLTIMRTEITRLASNFKSKGPLGHVWHRRDYGFPSGG